jgi:hypothetical protein
MNKASQENFYIAKGLSRLENIATLEGGMIEITSFQCAGRILAG